MKTIKSLTYVFCIMQMKKKRNNIIISYTYKQEKIYSCDSLIDIQLNKEINSKFVDRCTVTTLSPPPKKNIYIYLCQT